MFNIKPNINVTNTLRPYHMFLSLLMLQLSALGLRPLSNEVWAALQECPGNEDISCLFSLCLQLFISLQPQTLTPYSFLSHFLPPALAAIKLINCFFSYQSLAALLCS